MAHSLDVEHRPAWRSFWYAWLFCWLIVPLGYVAYKRYSTLLTVKDDEVSFEDGFFSKSSTEIKIRDIKTIEVHQTLIDRLLGVGELRLATAGTAGWEIVVKHLLDPQAIREDIQRRRGDANPS